MMRGFLFFSIFLEPNTPGKFIVWFRNETTLLVLWQPPYPAGIYTHYKVSIDPADAIESVLYVEKEGEPPGPAQAAFKGLVPGELFFQSFYHPYVPIIRNFTFQSFLSKISNDSILFSFLLISMSRVSPQAELTIFRFKRCRRTRLRPRPRPSIERCRCDPSTSPSTSPR